MMRRNEKEVHLGDVQVSLPVFLESYNKNIPEGFPRATVSILKKFRDLYPTLFKHGENWSIALHRKRVIDWLSSYRNVS